MNAIARVATLAAPSLALLLAACSVARNTEEPAGAGACTGCHGDASRASSQAAPPNDTHGATDSAQVGAHLAHLDNGVTCETCHVVPGYLAAPGHMDGGPAEINFGSAARQHGADPTYDPVAHTCSNTYCHGGSTTFATNTSPAWSASGLGCTLCHLTPPASHDAGATDCSSCHAETVAADDTTLIPGGGHLNGRAGGHADGFSDPAVHGPQAIAFLAGQAGALTCTQCHGSDYAGVGSAVSCNGCHASTSTTAFPSGVADWQANCTFCHGTPTEPYPATANPKLAAPPQGVAGATTGPSVGAHAAHVNGETISDGVLCGDCHTVPSDLTHVNGTPTVVTRRAGRTTTAGTFNGTTCSNTYCHGNFTNGKTANAPSWTATSGQAACDICHQPQWSMAANGTTTDRHGTHHPSHCTGCHDDGRPDCSMCHASYGAQPAVVNTALHVNGTVDVVPGSWVGYSPGATPSCNPGCHMGAGAHPGSGTETWR